MNEADEFSLAVIEEVQEAIKASGKSNAEVIKQAKISQDYFYTRMRGEKPFNTNDISRIADVIGIDALSLLMNASKAVEKAKVAFNPDAMSEDEKKRLIMEKVRRGDLGLAANYDPDKEAERDYYPDAGA
ncbi:MAG: hypothetical protein LKI98_04165 [Bifidobacterium crudilactis]|nr:hypothetical protein [Bifidobacterium crudilactis]